jgi:hypothetical protein
MCSQKFRQKWNDVQARKRWARRTFNADARRPIAVRRREIT